MIESNCEMKCCRCGKITPFYVIAPYGSKDDGEAICADCLDKPLIEHWPEEEVAFVRHIESHLDGQSIPCCKICGKNIFQIAEEARLRKEGRR
jgi:hypothetical protein